MGKPESTKELISDADNKINWLISELSMYDEEVFLSAVREKINTVSINRESLEDERTRLESSYYNL